MVVRREPNQNFYVPLQSGTCLKLIRNRTEAAEGAINEKVTYESEIEQHTEIAICDATYRMKGCWKITSRFDQKLLMFDIDTGDLVEVIVGADGSVDTTHGILAVSHLWGENKPSDDLYKHGFNVNTAKGWIKNRLDRIKLIGAKLYWSKEHWEPAERIKLVWFDLVAVNQSDPFAIRDGSYAMGIAYHAADMVLVLHDHDYTSTTAWSRRRWTLQEGSLARALVHSYTDGKFGVEFRDPNERFSLYDALVESQSRKSWLEQDAVYAIRYMVEGLQSLPIVYDISFENLLLRAINEVAQTGDLSMIFPSQSAVPGHRLVRPLGLKVNESIQPFLQTFGYVRKKGIRLLASLMTRFVSNPTNLVSDHLPGQVQDDESRRQLDKKSLLDVENLHCGSTPIQFAAAMLQVFGLGMAQESDLINFWSCIGPKDSPDRLVKANDVNALWICLTDQTVYWFLNYFANVTGDFTIYESFHEVCAGFDKHNNEHGDNRFDAPVTWWDDLAKGLRAKILTSFQSCLLHELTEEECLALTNHSLPINDGGINNSMNVIIKAPRESAVSWFLFTNQKQQQKKLGRFILGLSLPGADPGYGLVHDDAFSSITEEEWFGKKLQRVVVSKNLASTLVPISATERSKPPRTFVI